MDPFRWLQTATEVRLIVDHIEVGDAFCFASVCSIFRAATSLKDSKEARFPRGIRTPVLAMWSSVARLEWALDRNYKWKTKHCADAAREGHAGPLPARQRVASRAQPERRGPTKLAGLGQLRTSALSDSDGPTAHQQQPNSYVGLFAVVVRKRNFAVVVFSNDYIILKI